jgi:LysM repeat protein
MFRRSLALLIVITIFALNAVAAQDAAQPATTPDAVVQPSVPPAVQETTPEATAPVLAVQQPEATQAVTAPEQIYIVRSGDTLNRIATRFHVTVRAIADANKIVNPSLIRTGQQLRIPGTSGTQPTPVPAPTRIPSATPSPGNNTTYVVVRGDTLLRIALRYKTTISQLLALNNLRNPNVIYIGQKLNIPAGGASNQSPQPAAAGQNQANTASLARTFGYGIEVNLVNQDAAAVSSQLAALGVKWVKQPIYWRDLEPVKGQIDFATLDNIVKNLRANNLTILFTVSTSPSWARTYTIENGPPDNLADYAAFISALAKHFAGQVQSYEIWNEPNIRLEWSCSQPGAPQMCKASYLELLKLSHTAVKTADPTALVISAGLAPTGFNDGVNAINDRLFLKTLVASGLNTISDAAGVHPNGWANPPDALCCIAPVGVESHYQDSSFFFRNTLEDYRQILVAGKDANFPLWVTKFGWGSSEDTDPPSQDNVFLTYTSLAEQAVYAPRGFQLAASLGYVGPMFLYNFNSCQAQPDNVDGCYYSLIGSNGSPRPVFESVKSLLQAVAATPTPAPTATIESLPTNPPTATATIETTIEATSEATIEATQELTPESTLDPEAAANLPLEPTAESTLDNALVPPPTIESQPQATQSP